MKSRRFDLVVAVALGTAIALPAAADPGEPPAPAEEQQLDRAREAFRLGSLLANQGQWTEALAAFERSANLHAHATTTYNLGFCERALGHTTRARKLFEAALEQDQKAKEPELSEETRALARSYLAEAEARVARAVVTVKGRDSKVTVDGRPLEPARMSGRRVLIAGTRDPGPGEKVDAGTFELWADPGQHIIVLTEGSANRVFHRRFKSGETSTLVLGEDPQREREPRPSRPPDRTPAIVAFGVGAAGLVVGATSGVIALQKKGKLDDDCTSGIDRCDPRYQGDIDTMNRAATISTVGFGVAAVGIAAGAYFWIAAGPTEPSPRVGVGPGGLSVQTRF